MTLRFYYFSIFILCLTLMINALCVCVWDDTVVYNVARTLSYILKWWMFAHLFSILWVLFIMELCNERTSIMFVLRKDHDSGLESWNTHTHTHKIIFFTKSTLISIKVLNFTFNPFPILAYIMCHKLTVLFVGRTNNIVWKSKRTKVSRLLRSLS